MKIGDLVRYRGWKISNLSNKTDPLAIIVEQRSKESDFHHRVRVLWLGEEIPVQAAAVSTTGKRISSWFHPKVLEVV